MKLATIRTKDTTNAAVLVGEHLVEVDGFADVGALLADGDWRDRAASASGADRKSVV